MSPEPTSPAFVALHSGLAMALVAVLAVVTGAPLLFPALGASAVLVFGAPAAPTSRPRNVVSAHLLGAGVGWLLLLATGRAGVGCSLAGPLDVIHATTGVLSLACTAWLMRRLDVHHPAAGATTMIVALGLLPHARQLGAVALGAVLLCLHARLVLRRAGHPYPWWR